VRVGAAVVGLAISAFYFRNAWKASQDSLDYQPIPSYLSMTGLFTAALHNTTMIDLFARRSKVATRAIGMADVLTPVQVRVFSDCEMRWFYQHLLAVPDPPTASMALDRAIRAALLTNFRHKLACREDLADRSRSGTVSQGMRRSRRDALHTSREAPCCTKTAVAGSC